MTGCRNREELPVRHPEKLWRIFRDSTRTPWTLPDPLTLHLTPNPASRACDNSTGFIVEDVYATVKPTAGARLRMPRSVQVSAWDLVTSPQCR